MLTVNPTNHHIIKDGVDLGHVIDAIVNKTVDAAEARGALEVARIGLHEEINVQKREVEIRAEAATQASSLANERKGQLDQAAAVLADREAQLAAAAAAHAAKEAELAAAEADAAAKAAAITAKDAALIDALQEISDLKDAAAAKDALAAEEAKV
jgi:hypothetical protein